MVSKWMLQTMRGFVIEHKGVFLKAIIAFAKILPEPTKENTLEPNSHVFLDMEEEFFGFYSLESRIPLWRAAWKIFICEYEHDPHPRNIFDWVIEELVERVLSGEIKPRRNGHPMPSYWSEPRPYGEYVNRQFKNLIKS